MGLLVAHRKFGNHSLVNRFLGFDKALKTLGGVVHEESLALLNLQDLAWGMLVLPKHTLAFDAG
jgi:hypothetical protein